MNINNYIIFTINSSGFGDIKQKVGCGFRRLDGVAGLAIGSSLDRRRCRQQQERNGAA